MVSQYACPNRYATINHAHGIIIITESVHDVGRYLVPYDFRRFVPKHYRVRSILLKRRVFLNDVNAEQRVIKVVVHFHL